MLETVLPVKGMTCTMCAMNVRRALENLEGVDRANVNFKKNNVAISYEDTKVTLEEMQRAVHDAGYTLIIKKKSEPAAPGKRPARMISYLKKLFRSS